MEASPTARSMQQIKSRIEAVHCAPPARHVIYRIAQMLGREDIDFLTAALHEQGGDVTGTVTVFTETRTLAVRMEGVRALAAGGDQTHGSVFVRVFPRRSLCQISVGPEDIDNDAWLDAMKHETWPYQGPMQLRYLADGEPVLAITFGSNFDTLYERLQGDLTEQG